MLPMHQLNFINQKYHHHAQQLNYSNLQTPDSCYGRVESVLELM